MSFPKQNSIIIIIIQFNSILYYLCAEPTATRPIQTQHSVDKNNYFMNKKDKKGKAIPVPGHGGL
jgi:hypothetical protein